MAREKISEIRNKYPYMFLTEYFVRENNIVEETPYKILDIPARLLITPERIDLMAKWIYIYHREKNLNMESARELYMHHIEAFSNGTFIEPGTEDKNSIEKYFDEFDRIIDSVKENGFDEAVSLVPVGKDGVLLDGSHRCAACAYFNKNIKVIYFDFLERNFNFTFFLERGLKHCYLKRMALAYTELKSNLFFACIWPKADNEFLRKRALEIICNTCGDIVYHGDVKLYYQGLYNLMIQIYGHQEWTGTYEDGHAGVKEKATRCYKRGAPVMCILFECKDFNMVLSAKKQIRNLFNIENHSVHISDTYEETRQMANLLFNQNSIHHMNYGNPDKDWKTNQRVLYMNDVIRSQRKNINEFVIDSSSVMGIYGIRPARDLDYITAYKDFKISGMDGIDNHEDWIKYYPCSKNDLLYNPKYYLVYGGIKYISLNCLVEMKRKRSEVKDKKDIRRVKRFLVSKKIVNIICEFFNIKAYHHE